MEECDALDLDLDLDTSAIEAGTVLYKCRECAKVGAACVMRYALCVMRMHAFCACMQVIWRPGTCLGINTARTTSGAGVDGGQ